jgi:hypothetical protein
MLGLSVLALVAHDGDDIVDDVMVPTRWPIRSATSSIGDCTRSSLRQRGSDLLVGINNSL